jgi:hypothetical protein
VNFIETPRPRGTWLDADQPKKEDAKPCRFWTDQDKEWNDRQDIEQRLLRKGVDIRGLNW